MIVLESFVRVPFPVKTFIANAPDYKTFEKGQTLNTWPLDQDWALMEGRSIPVHDDGDEFYQPLLVLRNDNFQWSIRGANQRIKNLSPQIPGTILILDIAKKHLVSGRSKTPWLVLCYNPKRSVPLKQDYTPEGLVEIMKDFVKQKSLPVNLVGNVNRLNSAN